MVRPFEESRGEPRIAAITERGMGKDGKDAHRVSVTLSREQHAELERIARKHGMKVAWVVRRAAERLIEQENGGPLLPLNFEERSHARG
ncbi:ribbon-helix-helix domain-containing protein [Dankookia sp. GCM10030260]|uniref:ribbon-helix-helix domain-containing protein n=1 Tax=Dankookia sp. GCM10030260 TaxID=3273390 RepID=UPI0036115D3F